MVRPLNISNISVVDQTQPIPQKGFGAVALIDTTTVTAKAIVSKSDETYSDELNTGITQFIANGGTSLYVVGAIYDGADTANIEALMIDLIETDGVYHFSFIVETAKQLEPIYKAINDIAIQYKVMVTTEVNGPAETVIALRDLFNSKRLAFVPRLETTFEGAAVSVLATVATDEPGTATFSNKLMQNILPSAYTQLDFQQLLDADLIIIIDDRGYIICRESRTTSGGFIDTTTSIDYIEYRANMAITDLVINRKKLAYTDDDIALIKKALETLGNEFVSSNILASYKAIVPKASDVPDIDKSNRILNDVGFEVTLSGSIESLFIVLTAKL